MKTLFLACFLAFLCLEAPGQNLIPNPDFEQYSICPFGLNEVYKAAPWRKGSRATPDFYHCNFVNQGNLAGTALNGSGVMGMWGWKNNGVPWIENIWAPLQDTLWPGNRYLVSFWVMVDTVGALSAPPNSCFDFGMYFFNSNTSLNYFSSGCPVWTPQVSIPGQVLHGGQYQQFSVLFEPSQVCDRVLVGPFCNGLTPSCADSMSVYFNLDGLSLTSSLILTSASISCQMHWQNGQRIVEWQDAEGFSVEKYQIELKDGLNTIRTIWEGEGTLARTVLAWPHPPAADEKQWFRVLAIDQNGQKRHAQWLEDFQPAIREPEITFQENHFFIQMPAGTKLRNWQIFDLQGQKLTFSTEPEGKLFAIRAKKEGQLLLLKIVDQNHQVWVRKIRV